MWQTKPEREQKEVTEQSRWGFRGMTVRNWLELLIVPLVLVGIGLLFEMQQANRQLATEQQQRAIAEQRAQDEALQAYLNQMSSLLLEKDLRVADKDGEVSTLARARTVTVLQRLDANRNQTVIRFLNEARLTGSSIGLLVTADLRGAQLEGTDLSDADLSVAELNNADLEDANMSGADLSEAKLNYANLSGAVLNNADLPDADLSGANMSGAFLRYADLREAQLIETNLRGADLLRADLTDAILSHVNLSDASGITDAQLEQAKILEDTTMPNGQKYEDWLKGKN